MCTVSAILDQGRRTWEPNIQPAPAQPYSPFPRETTKFEFVTPVSREEFEKLKKDFAELLVAVEAAKVVDEHLGMADCETEDKVAFIKKLADLLEVDLAGVFDD